MNQSKPKALFVSLLVSYVLSGILLLVISFALYKLKLKEEQVNMAVHIVYVAACFFGGMVAGKKIRSRKFFWGFLAGALYFLLLFLLSWITTKGNAFDSSRFLVVMACCLAGGTVGGILS